MRRRAAKKRNIGPDQKFNNVAYQRFINAMMWDGKKSVASTIFYDAVDLVATKIGKASDVAAACLIVDDALSNVRPMVEVRSRRVGGATYSVPMEVRPERALALSFRWLITNARKRPEKTMAERLANEFVEAANSRGAAYKKKEDVHRMAEANKAFAHYRW